MFYLKVEDKFNKWYLNKKRKYIKITDLPISRVLKMV